MVFWYDNEPMNWDDYRLILALIRQKTVRGAAKSLGVSHATVSRRLAHLNGRPGGPFIQKSPSGLWPTKSGEVVLEAAEQMERLVDQAARKHRASRTSLAGPLCISIPNLVLEYVLFDAVTEFAEAYPDIELTVDASDNLVDLDRAEADIVVRTSEHPPEQWVGRRLLPYTLSIYAHRQYLATTSPDAYRWIAPDQDSSRWPGWLDESPYPSAPIALRITSIPGRFHALRQGAGIGRAACFMADQIPELVRLPNAPVIAAETFWVLSHPDFAKTDRARVAIRFFSERLKQRQGLIQGSG